MHHQFVTFLAPPSISLAPGLCCDMICAMDCEAFDAEDVAYLGLSGDARLARRDVEMVMGDGDEEVAFLRKTRAGGNWLTGGIVICMDTD
jgi:hypothetical protein